ncbi:YveK family protein [Oribacterium sp. WCC10]|uniref:YveK family protein n=1 Tax=Oribacterium sp. WCC10 TaxID=1855343 RepID=UPI0008E47501|nr:Wzz/FepE/Etk N-terminal domain-containing protein [Oribacterium sp. WCC10]SFG65414.1 Capsular polysaccharide biosynthesis protein [Oribacterium sp. WCC10]
MPENNTIQPKNVVALKRVDDNVITIDLVELFFELKKHIVLLILSLIIGGGVGYAISRFVMVPTYTSTSIIYVMSKETTLTSLADLQIGSQLTADYKVLVTSRTVMENAIKKLNIEGMDYLDLRKKITLNNPNNTRILNISVLDTDPKRAKELTDAVSECASDYIADIMEQDPPKIIEYGEIPWKKTGPHTGKNTVISAMLFLMVAIAGVTISMVTDDTIKTQDDIDKYFNLPVLASIPEKDPEAAKKADQYNYAYRNKKHK